MRHDTLRLLVLLLIVSLSVTACEPLRKKFRRKKKEEKQDTQFVPVLAPEEYATPEFDPLGEYRHRYNLWNLWYDDFMTGLEEDGSNKRQQYLLGQMAVQLEEMGKLLPGDLQAQLEDHRKNLQDLQSYVSSPMRNTIIIKNKINAVNAQVRGKFSPDEVKDKLLP